MIDGLWQVALECALKRQNGKCRYMFDSMQCSSCRWYIKHYSTESNASINLRMIRAETSASVMSHNISLGYWSMFIIIAFIVLLFVSPMILDSPFDIKQIAFSHIKDVITFVKQELPYNTIKEASYNAKQESPYKMIDNTLTIVARLLRAKPDVNGDGLTNCIDAAVLFYQHYPVRNEVKMMLNNNRSTDFNHLFNAVLVDDNWYTIEPQAYFNGLYTTYWMTNIWGKVYDSSFDRDDTQKYLKYVK